MTDMKKLEALLAKVEAGDVSGWRCFMQGLGLNPDDRTKKAYLAYNGSLDAAKALHESVLPNTTWFINNSYRGNEPECGIEGYCISCEASNHIPSRAWLMAIIKALISEAQQ